MKRIIVICLLGISGLLSQSQVVASTPIPARIVNSTIEGWVFVVESDETSGTIQSIEIYDMGSKEVAHTTCTNYDCSIDLSSLPHGSYTAKVYTQYSYYTTKFTL